MHGRLTGTDFWKLNRRANDASAGPTSTSEFLHALVGLVNLCLEELYEICTKADSHDTYSGKVKGNRLRLGAVCPALDLR